MHQKKLIPKNPEPFPKKSRDKIMRLIPGFCKNPVPSRNEIPENAGACQRVILETDDIFRHDLGQQNTMTKTKTFREETKGKYPDGRSCKV